MVRSRAVARSLRGVLLVGLIAVAGGCTEEMWVDQYPAFYDPNLRTVAVAGFAGRTRDPHAGRTVTDDLTRALRANGTYEVLSPTAWRSKLAKAKLPAPDENDVPAIIDALRQVGEVQAVLTGEVGMFRASGASHTHVDRYDPPGWGYYGGYGGYGGYGRHGRYRRPYYRPYYPPPIYYVWHEMYNEGRVSAGATMFRVADGSEIHSTPAAAEAVVVSQGSPADLTPAGCLAQASRDVARQLVEEFAVVPRQIKVKPKDVLKIAAGRDGQRWTYTDDLPADLDEAFVVVALPTICDRNTFRLVIATTDKEKLALAEMELTWSREDTESGYPFSPRRLAAEGGAGKYEVRFYRRNKHIMSRQFKIEADKHVPPRKPAGKSATTKPAAGE